MSWLRNLLGHVTGREAWVAWAEDCPACGHLVMFPQQSERAECSWCGAVMVRTHYGPR